jgi:hypothetical protein
MRRLFQTILATLARRKQDDGRYDACRRVEITIEREVVEVIHPLGRTPRGANPEPVEAEPAGNENRCSACGQAIAPPQSLLSPNHNATSRTILEEGK